jgi:hypothetical protein
MEQLDAATLSVFEIIGSHFCSTLFNTIYNQAQHMAATSRAQTSLTDAYMRCVRTYIRGIKDKDSYGKLLHGFHMSYAETTRYKMISFDDFVSRIVEVFVPREDYRLLVTKEKDEVMCHVVTSLVGEMGAVATAPEMLRRIIDTHEVAPAVTIRMLQDSANATLALIRLEIHSRFHCRESGRAGITDAEKSAIRRVAETAMALSGENDELRGELRRLRRELKNVEIMLAETRKQEALLERKLRKMGAPPPRHASPPRRSSPPRRQASYSASESESESESSESESESESASSDQDTYEQSAATFEKPAMHKQSAVIEAELESDLQRIKQELEAESSTLPPPPSPPPSPPPARPAGAEHFFKSMSSRY